MTTPGSIPVNGTNPAKVLDTTVVTTSEGEVHREVIVKGSPDNADALQQVDETPQAARVVMYDAAGVIILDSTANALKALLVDAAGEAITDTAANALKAKMVTATGDNVTDDTADAIKALLVDAAGSDIISPAGVVRSSVSIGQAEITEAADGYSIVHKFGRNASIGSAYVPICNGGIYRTPQVAGATKVRVKAGDANDTADGSGAREIIIQGLDATGAFATEALATAGASAGADSANTYIRVFRAWVSKSGTYVLTAATGSHVADIVIEKAAGSEDWLTISSATSIDRAQTQIGCYTVPLGKTAFLNNFYTSVDANKAHDLILMQRPDILQTAAPYSGMRMVEEFIGLQDPIIPTFSVPDGPFPALTDLIWLGRISAGSADISVDFEILLKDA